MRLIIFITYLTISCALFGQSPKDKITIDVKNADLKSIIQAIEQKTKYRFIYGEDIKLKTPVTLSAKDQSIENILFMVFSNQGIKYEFKKSHIVLTKIQPTIKQSTARRHTISGYITDAVSGETFIGANIYNITSGEGTITNEYGFYSITVPEGETQLRFSYVGCEPESRNIMLDKNTELNIKLKPNRELSEVVIYGQKSETGINATQMGALDIPLEVMKSTPALLGEADIMKTIQMMPGVQAGTEGSAGVYVRGGGSDENLILLDGVPLYNVDHLFGFFSVFTPDAIKKVSLFKGSFPARFGGRLSSVIDVRTNDGDMKKYRGTFGMGLLSSKIQFEGPIIKDRTSFNVSLRRSYWDFVAKPFMDKDSKFGYYFYDVNAKINHRFSDRSRLFVSLYHGKDKLDTRFRYGEEYDRSEDKIDLYWGNFLAAAKWNYQISPKLFSNTTVAFTEYKFNADSRSHDEMSYNSYDYSSKYGSGIRDLAFNMDFDYHPLPKHHVKFGVGYLNHMFKPEVQTSRIKNNEGGIVSDTTYTSMADSRMSADEANIYAEDNFSIGDKFSANLGFHMSLFNIRNKTYTSFQPRISARYQLSKNVAVKASYTKMSQYIHLLSSYTITMPSDLWVPATENIKPMQSHQYSIGGYYTGFKDWELSVEAYYKDMNNVLEYKDGSSFLGSSRNWESKVEMGDGRAMGIEFMAQRKIGKATGWLAYTLAKSDRKFAEDGINNGRRYPYRYDRRHHISAIMNYKFSEKIDVGASWEFYTGGTTTLSEEKTSIIRPDENGGSSWDVNYIESRNNYRMPCSHRLNLGINFNRKTKRGGMSIWSVSVYNVYNAMNPTFLYKSDFSDDERRKLTKVTLLPCIPSVSYTYKF